MTEIIINTPQEMIDSLTNLANAYPAEMAQGVWLFQNRVLRESAIICPVRTGYLRGSRYANHPIISDGRISGEMGYTASYAHWVHELIMNYHKPPTQAKFLEVPLLQAAPDMVREILQTVERIIVEGR